MISHWISSYGSLTVFILVAFESIGIPLPGETAVISAAMYAGATHNINIETLTVSAGIGAIIGGLAGWWIGGWFGHIGLKRHGWRIGLSKKRLAIGRLLFRYHGRKIIFLSRFMAFLRSIATLLAGANGMTIKRFLPTHILSSSIWAISYCLTFYFFGQQIKLFEHSHKSMTFAGVVALGVCAVFVVWFGHRWIKQIENNFGRSSKS